MKMTQFVQSASKVAMSFLMVGSSAIFASVKVRGGGGDYNLRLLEAKQMAQEMITSFVNSAENCYSALDQNQCSFIIQNGMAMAESLKNSTIIPAANCFEYDLATQKMSNVKEGSKGFCFSDFYPNDKMMTFTEVGAPLFVNINQTLNMDVGLLAKLFIHESFHHLGLNDRYESGVEGNLPDVGAEVIFGHEVIKNPEYLKKILQSRNFSGPGIDEEQQFELVWTSAKRGDQKGLGFKAHDQLSMRGLLSPAPEFYVQIDLCNRTAPVKCHMIADMRDQLKVVRNNKMEKFEESVRFTGEDVNRAYHKIHAQVMSSGDPAGHDLRIRLVEDDFSLTKNRTYSNKEFYAESILPLESLYTGAQSFDRIVIDRGEQGLSGKNTGATAEVELRVIR